MKNGKSRNMLVNLCGILILENSNNISYEI